MKHIITGLLLSLMGAVGWVRTPLVHLCDNVSAAGR